MRNLKIVFYRVKQMKKKDRCFKYFARIATSALNEVQEYNYTMKSHNMYAININEK